MSQKQFTKGQKKKYIFRYNNIRIQSNLGYCTPIEYMCKLLVNQTFNTFLKSKFISLSIN